MSEACGRGVERRAGINDVLGLAGHPYSCACPSPWQVGHRQACVCVLRTPVTLDIFLVVHVGVRHLCADVHLPLGRWRERVLVDSASLLTIERCRIGGGLAARV